VDAVEILFTASLWAAAVRIASPLIFATMGELLCERAGVLNLGIEGIMTAGAFAGWLTVYFGGDLWLGVLVAALVGAAFGLLHAFLVVPLGLSQHVTGIGITLLATSLSYYCYRLILPEVTTPPKIVPFAPLRLPLLSDIPVLGDALFRQTPLTYLAFVVTALVAWFLYRTPAGLAVRTRRKSCCGRGSGCRRRCCAHVGRGGGLGPHGRGRRLSHHVRLQLFFL
jgi:simple sugar transport system permease protein